MAFLSRDDILKADDIATETVAVPEWGGEVLVRGLTGAERDDYEASLVDLRAGRKHARPDLRNTRAKLVARCLVDEAGRLLFSERDVALLGRKSGAALDRVYDVAARLSGLGQDAEDEAEGNSEAPSDLS